MSRFIVAQDDHVTEYSDGAEECSFTEEQWAVMRTDPAFGYVRTCGHPTTINSRGELVGDGCLTCEFEAERLADQYYTAQEAEHEAAMAGLDDTLPSSLTAAGLISTIDTLEGF